MQLPSILFLQTGGAGTINFLFLGAMLLIFWLFLIRPQAKRQREQKSFQESLERGDQVVTSSGILGKITKMEDQVLTLEVSNKTYLRVTRNSISKEMTEAIYAVKDKDDKSNDKDQKQENQDSAS
jgi:preprotein translocase subunit YajC